MVGVRPAVTLEAAVAQALAERQRGTMISFAVFEVDVDTDDRPPPGKRAYWKTQVVARCISGRLGPAESFVRTDQERFLVILPGMPIEAALIRADAIRHSISEQWPPGLGAAITVSGGVAEFPGHGRRASTLSRVLSGTVLRARTTGGNRVVAMRERATVIKAAQYPVDVVIRLKELSREQQRSESSLLREALRDLLAKYRRQE